MTRPIAPRYASIQFSEFGRGLKVAVVQIVGRRLRYLERPSFYPIRLDPIIGLPVGDYYPITFRTSRGEEYPRAQVRIRDTAYREDRAPGAWIVPQ